MKTEVSPKLIQNIDDDSVVLWFEKSNKYVVTSDLNSRLIQLYTNPDHGRDSFVSYLEEKLQVQNNKCQTIFDDITAFLDSVNSEEVLVNLQKTQNTPPNNFDFVHFYEFYGKRIQIRYESEAIKGLIHPQIEHHCVAPQLEFETQFDIYRTSDDLHLVKDGIAVGSYKTNSFHFLQGRFALELTNSIHNTDIDKWIATFHASTLSNGKEAIMLIGDSGNGKSTLSAILMAQGFDLLCDDFTPLYEDTMNLYRYPAATSIKKGAFEALKPYFSHIQNIKTHTNGPKKVNIKYIPPLLQYDNLKTCFPCHKIVYVKYNKEKRDRMDFVSKEKILETLIPDSWISPTEAHARKFIHWLKNIDCYELNYNNNDFAISKFKALFKG